MKLLNMRHIIGALLVVALFANNVRAGEKSKDSGKGINWLTWDEVQVEMKKKPKKVWVDIYTDWCGWCKVMDKKTFSNPDVIKYMNEHFYAVKFNAERKDEIMFQGKSYGFSAEHNAHELAAKLVNGEMSYPTFIVMEENFLNPQPIPGYIPVPRIESILKYLGEGIYKKQNFDDYSKTFTPVWKEAPEEPKS